MISPCGVVLTDILAQAGLVYQPALVSCPSHYDSDIGPRHDWRGLPDVFPQFRPFLFF
jgi:hypothetical protein